ncbi:MAG: metallophosphoesterase [Clostridia bacterium]|nr:metallophosphoesterase [Clostridia bacterium]
MEISTVLIYLKDLIATVLTLLMMISPAFGSTAEPYTAERPDELITGFAVVSDIHVETNNPESYNNLKNVLEGIKAGSDIDTVIYTGDNVMNGQLLENLFFYSAVRAVKPAENNFVVQGNHDYGNGEGDYEQLRQNYLYNNALYLGNTLSKDYYYRVVDGCYFICLASEDITSEDFMMSEAQYKWLEDVLKKAEEENAPVFVFAHFPLRYLDNDGTEYSRIDKTQLGSLLTEYGVELYVHGHIHNDIDGMDNFYESYGVECVNLCRVTETTDYEPGDGIVVEVYEDELRVRTRDFIKGEWIEELSFTHQITK